MANADGEKPAGSRRIASSLGTLVLAILLVAFGFWAGRTFETLWPSRAPAPPPTTMAVASPSPLPTLSPEPSPSASLVPSSSPSEPPSPAAVAGAEPVPADASPRPTRRSRRAAASPAPSPAAPPVPAVAPPPPAPPARPFVYGTSAVESLRSPPPQVPGFQPTGIKRAPQVPGRVDFEATPQSVKPGDSYAVRVFLVNEGGKSIAIDALNVAMVADGRRSARDMPPRARNVAPGERVLLTELPGVWPDGVASWALEVAVTSKRQDRYTNTMKLQ